MNSDKDTLAATIFTDLIASYPANAIDSFYAKDACYISSILIKHLRCTTLDANALARNSSFFRDFIKASHYQNRIQWITGAREALNCFFPIASCTSPE